MLADRRVLLRSELPAQSAIQLLEDVPPHRLPAQLVEMAQDAAGCRVALYVVDIGGQSLRLVGGDERWPAEVSVDQALGPELTRGRMGDLQRAVEARMDGAAAVPLWLHGRALAVLICEERPHQALEPLARQAAAAIALADSYTDVLHRARRRRSTTPAAEIQENLLPPRFATLDGAELAAGIVPAYDVGGDWYDYAENPEGTWLAVADAAGKGPHAAGPSTIALGALRAARRGGLGLPETARAIDRAMRDLAETTFVTAVLAQWDARTGTLSWMRFGHPFPLLVDADGRCSLLQTSNHLPLGLLADHAELAPARLRLRAGDRVVFMSDGVADRRTRDGGFFGEHRTAATAAAVDEPGAVPLATALVAAVVGASDDQPRDDATVLVLAADD